MSGPIPELTAIAHPETEDEEAALVCPNPDCVSTDLQAVWDMPVVCGVRYDGESIILDYTNQRDCPDGAGENKYECAVCVTEFKLPDDIDITDDVRTSLCPSTRESPARTSASAT